MRERFGATAIALTDSGTSALVIALRAMVREGGAVALPAYGCVDLIAAAIRSGVRVRLYDVDPGTLGPDLDSVRRTVMRGVDALVVTHLYGYPADMAAVRAVTDAAGVQVIEDAAQHAGCAPARCGSRVERAGDCAELRSWQGHDRRSRRRGVRDRVGRQSCLQRRSRRGRASMVRPRARMAAGCGLTWPGGAISAELRHSGRSADRGCMQSPRRFPRSGLDRPCIGRRASRGRSRARQARWWSGRLRGLTPIACVGRTRARWYEERLSGVSTLALVRSIAGAEPGYLRVPVLTAVANDPNRAPEPSLGVVRTYPLPLGEEPAAAAVLHLREPAMPGARAICSRLFTLPTHAAVEDADAERIVAWAKAS